MFVDVCNQDAILKQHWDAWVKEDVEKHNTMQNRQVCVDDLSPCGRISSGIDTVDLCIKLVYCRGGS